MRSKDPELMEKIVRFAEEFYVTEGRSPSTSEIAGSMGCCKATVYHYLVEMDKRGIITYDGRDIRTEYTDKYYPEMASAVHCGSIRCGTPEEEIENIEQIVSLPTAIFGTGELYILTAGGESMIGIGIEEGDLVVVKKQQTAKVGEIVVAMVDGKNTLKTLCYDDDRMEYYLHPENPTMQDIYLHGKPLDIQGVAKNIIKKI